MFIGATSLTTGTSRVFHLQETSPIVDIIMASTALPLLFPPQAVLGELFLDGGLSDNVLMDSGVGFCHTQFPGESVTIDVVMYETTVPPWTAYACGLVSLFKQIGKLLMHRLQDTSSIRRVRTTRVTVRVYEKVEQCDDVGILDFSQGTFLYDLAYSGGYKQTTTKSV